jgi:hypothetical protein
MTIVNYYGYLPFLLGCVGDVTLSVSQRHVGGISLNVELYKRYCSGPHFILKKAKLVKAGDAKPRI